MLEDDEIEQSDEGEIKSVLLHVGYNMEPYEVKLPKAPDLWVDPPSNREGGGGLIFTKWKNQADGVYSPTVLYFCL